MKVYSAIEFRRIVSDMLTNGDADEQTDNENQIVIYTGFYTWNDLTIRDEPEPVEPN